MNIISDIINFEINYPKIFTNYYNKKFGTLFYNKNNPSSHDSNHSIILNFNINLDNSINEIINFYKSKKIIPLIYQSFSDQDNKLISLLKKYNFEIIYKKAKFYIYNKNDCKINIKHNKLKINRIKKINNNIIDLLLFEDNGIWNINKLKNAVKNKNFYLFAGSLENKIVTIGSINVDNKLSRIDDIKTHSNFRNQGYCTKLLNYMIDFYNLNIKNKTLYLYSENPIAIKIYKKLGFVEIKEELKLWGAFLK